MNSTNITQNNVSRETFLGKHENMSNQEYHAHKDSISRSAIVEFSKSPYKYWANYLNPNRPDQKKTSSMIFGEAFHCMILEPNRFDNEFCVEPELHKLPKVGLLRDLGREKYENQKASRAAVETMNESIKAIFSKESERKTALSLDDYNLMLEMKNSLMLNKEAWDLIQGAVYECSYFWTDPDTGILLKARPDILHPSVVVDLKTCRDASYRAFQRSIVEGGYHIQAAMILDAIKAVEGKEISTFINIAIEKEYPYSIAVYILDEIAIETGRNKYKSILTEMKKSIETKKFSDYETQIMSLPNYID